MNYNPAVHEFTYQIAIICNSLRREPDGAFWAKVRWYIIPEETAAGRQPHNLRRELYRSNDIGDIEVISVFPGYVSFHSFTMFIDSTLFVLVASTDGNYP
jgi:hypothetical protein